MRSEHNNQIGIDREGSNRDSSVRDRLERKRESMRVRIYLISGLKQILKSPLKLLLIGFMVLGLLIALYLIGVYMPDIGNHPIMIRFSGTVASLISIFNSSDISISTEMVNRVIIIILTYSLKFIITVIVAMPLLKLLVWFGKPRFATSIEDDVQSAFNLTDKQQYKRPILLSRVKIGAKVTEYVFCSKWITCEAWENPALKEDLLQALGGNKILKIEYQDKNKRHKKIIVIHVGYGGNPAEGGKVLYDEEF